MEFNLLSIFVFSTDEDIYNVINKSADKILYRISNDATYCYYVISSSFNIVEIKEIIDQTIIDSGSSSVVLINNLNENDFDMINTGFYSKFKLNKEDLFNDIEKCDEIQLTEYLDEDISNSESVVYDSKNIDEKLLDLFLDKDLISEDKVMADIDILLDKGDLTEIEKKKYDFLVNTLKKIKNDK